MVRFSRFSAESTGFALLLSFILHPLVLGYELSKRHVDSLASEEFKVRENAQLEILAQARQEPGPAIDELYRLSQISEDPEVRQRCLWVIRQLLKDRYTTEGQGFVGIGRIDKTIDIPGEELPVHGVLVTNVWSGSPADRAGIQLNDMILALNGTRWNEGGSSELFANQIASSKPGTKVTLQILRREERLSVEVILARKPADVEAFMRGRVFDAEWLAESELEQFYQDWLKERRIQN